MKLIIPGARIVVGIRRAHPVESSCARRRRGLLGLSADQHAFERCCGPLLRLPVWFVDNVTTTGNTIKAAHLAFGTGGGIVYADASSYTLLRASRIDRVAPTPFDQHASGLKSHLTDRLASATRV
jgi:hypothetical protein